jgi:TRAP-type mannitol/chloroaromatic compound transport system substrate-binding protein
MERRRFLTGTALAAAGAGLAAPALAQQRIEWDMVTSWPTGAPGLDDSARRIAKRITDLSDGRLNITVHGAGEIVPSFGVFDAVSQGVAQMYHSVPAYWISKNKAIGMFGSFPFGMNMYEKLGWMYWGGGQDYYDKIYDGFGLKGYLAGGTGPQWFGWFREEINTLDDLRGMRIRTTGFSGEMLRRVGVAVVTLPGGEVFQALQSGTIDAGEFVGPWNDFAFGFHQVAKHYYGPGVGEPCSTEEIAMNASAYQALPDDLKQIIKTVAMSAAVETTQDYELNNAKTLRILRSEHGVNVHKVPDEIVVGLAAAANEMVQELLADPDPMVREVMASYAATRNLMTEYAPYATGGQYNARTLMFPES